MRCRHRSSSSNHVNSTSNSSNNNNNNIININIIINCSSSSNNNINNSIEYLTTNMKPHYHQGIYPLNTNPNNLNLLPLWGKEVGVPPHWWGQLPLRGQTISRTRYSIETIASSKV